MSAEGEQLTPHDLEKMRTMAAKMDEQMTIGAKQEQRSKIMAEKAEGIRDSAGKETSMSRDYDREASQLHFDADAHKAEAEAIGDEAGEEFDRQHPA